MSDFATLRRMMVDTQIRPSDVTKFPIIEAFLSIKREAFVPDNMVGVAYSDASISFAAGREILEPRTLAKMLDALDLQPTELVLDLGCGLGYSAAIVAHLCEAVIAVEEDADIVAEAQANLAAEGVDNAVMIEAPLTDGAAQHGPYDVITVQGAVQDIPAALLDQLKDGGRIAAIFTEGALGEVRVGHKSGGQISWRLAFNAGAPVLPGYAKAAQFAL